MLDFLHCSSRLSFLHNLVDPKLFSDLYLAKFLNISAKSSLESLCIAQDIILALLVYAEKCYCRISFIKLLFQLYRDYLRERQYGPNKVNKPTASVACAWIRIMLHNNAELLSQFVHVINIAEARNNN